MASRFSIAASQVLQRHNAELVTAISASNLLCLALSLYGEGLIERETKDEVCLLMVYTPLQKACIIVSAVERKVEADPSLFHQFITFLQDKGDDTLRLLGTKLKEALANHEIQEDNLEQSHTQPQSSTPNIYSDLNQSQSPQQPPFIKRPFLCIQSQSPLCQSPPTKRHQLSLHYKEYPALCLFSDKLRTIYAESELPKYSNPACYKWTPSPSKKYIDLTTINKKKMTPEQEDECKKAVLYGQINKITKKGYAVAVKLEEILRAEPGEELKCILVEGAPGIGKSTLAWQLCNRWGKRELFQQYFTVLLLPLRDHRVQGATCVKNLFISTDEDLQEKVRKEVSQENWDGKDTLIILEGLDELPIHLLSQCSIFTGLISGEILSQATILLTSRPSATEQLWNYWNQRISRHFEIHGFTEEDIYEYVQSVLPENQISGFKEYISIHPHFQSMLYVPLHCVIAVTVYSQCQKSCTLPPRTLTGLYTRLAQTILTQYLKDNPQYKSGDYTLDTVFDQCIPNIVNGYFRQLCRIAFEHVLDQQLVFPELPKELHDLGFTDAVPELLLYQQSANYSYNFLHLSVQEYLAAYHVSLMSISEQEELLCSVKYRDYCLHMVRFLAGISHFKGLSKAVIRSAIGIGYQHLSMYSLEILYECQDAALLSSESTYEIFIPTESISAHQLLSLGYCIANSRSKWELKFTLESNDDIYRDDAVSVYSDDSSDDDMYHSQTNFNVAPLFNELNESDNQNYLIRVLTEYDQIVFCKLLEYQPEHTILPHIKTLRLNWCKKPSPPSHLPELIHRMERLNTLKLINIPNNLLEVVITALSSIPELKNVLINAKSEKLQMVSDTTYHPIHYDPSTVTIKSSLRATHQFLSQLHKRVLAQIKSLTIEDIPLPSSLPKLTSRMEILKTLTLKNVLDTSLTSLIPVLSEIPTLRNLQLHKLNSEGINALCQWLSTCHFELEELTVGGRNYPTVKFTFGKDNNIETIICYTECKPEYINLILSQFQTSELLINVTSMSIYSKFRLPMEHYIPYRESPLPSYTPELLPRMERLESLTLLQVLESSITELIPVLCRVPNLRKITLPKLNSESLLLLCQWLSMCQLETIAFNGYKVTFQSTSSLHVDFTSGCTTGFIQQILTQIQLSELKSLTINTIQLQPLPPSLPELIPTMVKLSTLTLQNVLDTSLTVLISVLSRVPNLRNLTLHKLNSKGIALLCQQLPVCLLEKLIVYEEYPNENKSVITLIFNNNYIEAIDCKYCTMEFTDHFLLQLPQQSVAHIKTITIHIKFEEDTEMEEEVLMEEEEDEEEEWEEEQEEEEMEEGEEKGRCCLSVVIPQMKNLNSLTLINLLESSLADMIPILSTVPTLRNLLLPKLNLKGIVLLCQWLPTCQLEELLICDSPVLNTDNNIIYPTLRFISCKEVKSFFIATIECNYAMEYFNLVLTQMQTSKLSMSLVQSVTINTECLQPLLPCLPELIPRMDTLNKLTLMNVHDSSMLRLVPKLSRVPTLKKVKLHKLNSDGIAHLCQQLPSLQLKKLTIYDTLVYDDYNSAISPIVIFTFSETTNFHIETIECIHHCCESEVINQVLSQLVHLSCEHRSLLSHIRLLTIKSSRLLMVHLPDLIPRLERLNTLTLDIALDSSQRGLLSALSTVHTLRKFKIQSVIGKLEMVFPTDNLLPTGTIHGTSKLIDQFLQQLPQNTLAHIGSLIIENSREDYQPLSPSLLELIPKMKRLNTLTLKNVLNTSLTELILLLSRVPSLKNLTLPRLNLDDTTYLYQWLPACQLDTLKVCEGICSSVAFTHSGENKSLNIEITECKSSYTTNFIDHAISLFQTSEILVHVKYTHLQSLPPYLIDLIPKMKGLHSLALENVLDVLLTELIPALSRVSTLRTLILPRLNSEGIVLLCQWILTYKLETLIIQDTQMYDSKTTLLDCVCFECNRDIRSYQIGCMSHFMTTEFIEEVLLQVQTSKLLLANVKSITLYAIESQPLTACLQELISRMEGLDSLTLENILDNSLMELVPLLSRVPALKCLTLSKLNSEGITLLCQWLPTCQLETLKLPFLLPGHIEMVSCALTAVSSLKTLDIQSSKFTFQCMQTFVSMLQANKSLNEINICSCSIDSDSACRLFEALHHNNTLRKLDMSGNTVGERGAIAIASMLKHNNTILDELNVNKVEISSDGVIAIAEALHYNTTLRKLSMRWSKIGERGAIAIANMLKHNTTLEELNLSSADIENDGTVAIAKSLHQNRALRSLDLSLNKAGKRGTFAIAEMLKHNVMLEQLDFRCSVIKVSNKAINEIIVNLAENQHLKRIIILEKYKQTVESVPAYHDCKKRVEFISPLSTLRMLLKSV